MATIRPNILGGAVHATGERAADLQLVGTAREVDVDIVVPMYNEQVELGSSIITLVEHLRSLAGSAAAFSWCVVIADNASTDRTW